METIIDSAPGDKTTTGLKQSIPWVEKYRPTNFDDIVLDPVNRKIFKNILEKNYFPNLLFYGPPGTGKTTTIINIINEYQVLYNQKNKGTIIHLNASDERGIDIIRSQIHQFVKSKNFFEAGLKFVILDEVDYMTKNAQQALKYLLQSSCYNVRFCLICNYISKIDESLKNEFICIRFNQLPKNDIYKFIKNITKNENLDLSDAVIDRIQQIYNSDIRSMINFIQLNQNITMWEENIITDEVWENLHEFLSHKQPAFLRCPQESWSGATLRSDSIPTRCSGHFPEIAPSGTRGRFLGKICDFSSRAEVTDRSSWSNSAEVYRSTMLCREAAPQIAHFVVPNDLPVYFRNVRPTLGLSLKNGEDWKTKMNSISLRYNMDKKGILKNYFNYIIRKKSEVISEDFLTIAEMVMHSNDTNLHHIFEYFILHMNDHLSKGTN